MRSYKNAVLTGNWKRGKVGNYYYEIKVYEEPSEDYGIKGGRISKLEIWHNDEKYDYKISDAHYDRGWDKRPETAEAKAALEAILKQHS